jgi:hypothetical protein
VSAPFELPRLVIEQMGQRYELVDVEPYRRKDGESSAILTWRGTCLDCGEPFEVKSGCIVSNDLRRRCDKHKRSNGKRTDAETVRRVMAETKDFRLPPADDPAVRRVMRRMEEG